jgi:hypothetical protein
MLFQWLIHQDPSSSSCQVRKLHIQNWQYYPPPYVISMGNPPRSSSSSCQLRLDTSKLTVIPPCYFNGACPPRSIV